ncbi:MAG: 1-deoxy-D-xylulose-5-phosphate reductoisomerase [Actinobacteria bacterium]|nr:1-deoxy-D-xylulose-5-phosphate reductoisomerase [Actinomycetota bacterium]
MSRLRVAVLGSTGSIGRQALDVAARFPERVEVVALAAHSSGTALMDQARRFGVSRLALGDYDAAERATADCGSFVAGGPEALEEIASECGADLVLNALVGAAGLRISIAALRSGARLALANKESLVVGGDLVTALGLDRIIPVDSEHSAIFQCLAGEPASAVSRIWLTASGGPFRGWDPERLAEVSVEEALAHPRWTMGPKITVDSATLMNKGLEAIEAHHLFGVGYDNISVVVHPQSCVHSMVEFADGSVKAHLGATDMRVPIQYAFSHPERWGAPVPPVDFLSIGSLEFEAPDLETFPSLRLAFDAGRAGGTAPAVLNAANEVAVASFLDRRCALDAIPQTVERVLCAHTVVPADSIETVEAADDWARREALRVLVS